METTLYLEQKVIDTEKYPIPKKAKKPGRKLGQKNINALTDEQKKERNRLRVQKFREKNKKE